MGAARTRVTGVVLFLLLLGMAAPRLAAAQTAPPATGAPGATPPPGAPPGDAPEDGVDQGVLDDANSGRAWLMPTALTPPGGTWSFSDYELFLISGSFSPTDSLALAFTTLIPIVEEQPFWGLFSAKLQLLKAGRLRFAGHGALNVITGIEDEDAITSGTLGGVATVCLDEECHSHVNGFLAAGFADSDQSSWPFLAAGSLIVKAGGLVKLVLELDTVFIAGEINETSDAYLAWYGLRFTSSRIGVDLGLVKPLLPDSEDDDDIFPIGFPWVSFTFRGLPDR